MCNNFEKNPACNITQDGRIDRKRQCPDSDIQKFWVLVDPVWSRLLTVCHKRVNELTILRR